MENKRIVVHVGPPKTGTSAIQKWCVDNKSLLESHGVLYPTHDTDGNGVSSGHLPLVCDITPPNNSGERAKITYSSEKFSTLIKDFENSSFTVLLLSSEYFIQFMKNIREQVTNVEFVAYLRNPIEIVESNYNQGVKRSRFTHKISVKSFSTFPHVGFLSEYKSWSKDDSLNIRLYMSGSDPTFSLIGNFIAFLGLDIQVKEISVNKSYCFEALEFKRWANTLELGGVYTNKLDNILQSYQSGDSDFSLIPPAMLEDIKAGYIQKASMLYQLANRESVERFLSVIKDYEPAKYRVQETTQGEFTDVLRFVSVNMGVHGFPFYLKLLSETKHANDPHHEWIRAFYGFNLKSKFVYFFRKAVTKILMIGKHHD